MLAGVAAAAVAAAQAQTISTGPVTGSVFDTVSHSIRSIAGVPGAAILGVAAGTWDLAMPSADGHSAIAIRNGQAYLIPDLTQPDTSSLIGNTAAAVDRIVWSADSTTAALFSTRSSQLQLVTGIKSTPAIATAISLGSGGEVAAWKISPDGGTIAYAVSAAGEGAVYLITGSNSSVRLGSFVNPRALAFSSDGASLFVFDRAKAVISRVDIASGSIVGSFGIGSPAPAAQRSGFARPGLRRVPPRAPSGPEITDLAVTADGHALIGLRGSSVCVFDLTGTNPENCSAIDISAAAINPIGSGLFVLDYPRDGGSAVWLWNASASAAFFVPAGVSAGAPTGKVTNAGN